MTLGAHRSLLGILLGFTLLSGCQNQGAQASEEPPFVSENAESLRLEVDAMASSAVVVSEEVFGTLPDGRPVKRFTLANGSGMRVRVMEFGAIVTSVEVPDFEGTVDDVVLGFDDLASYVDGHPYFGCVAGRYCGRIAFGRFDLDGRSYQLATNHGAHHLHGGQEGFDKKLWRGSVREGTQSASVSFSYLSADGEEGYPGNVQCEVTYTLQADNVLSISYRAEADAATPINLTHHSYWNLAGAGSGSIRDHVMELPASRYTETDAALIPTGRILNTQGTALDFTEPTSIGERLDMLPGGYDHNFVIDRQGSGLAPVALVMDLSSRRQLTILSTEPGLLFYSGNHLDSIMGKSGNFYGKHHGFCLEPQHFPDSPNHPQFPGTILRPGEVYRSQSEYRFGVVPKAVAAH